ncbi:MAG: DUF177 domain-containing protein [Bacteroidota bacterium]
MHYLNQFVIEFSGLEEGIHNFDFTIDAAFFNEFEYSEIRDGKVKVSVALDKQTTMLVLNFKIKGYLICMCDRCLEDYQQKISGSECLIVKFGESKSDESDEIRIIPSTEHQIDISHDIYEFINLLIPYKRVHQEDKNGKSACNPEILKKIDELNNQKNNDPRWDELKKISLKN